MRAQLSHTGRQAHIQQRDRLPVSGCDPLQEIYHWSLIISLLSNALVALSITFVPYWNNPFLLPDSLLNIRLWTVVIPLILLVCLANLLLRVLRLRRERRKRDRLRQKVLLGRIRPLALHQPPTVLAPLSLPLYLESRLTRRSVRKMLIWALVTLCAIVIDLSILLGNTWLLPSLLVDALSFLSIAIPFAVVIIASLMQTSITGYYLHPLLHVDTEGLSASYGSETVCIAWRNVCSFALVGGVAASNILQKKAEASSHPYDAFEISDGEQRICWAADSPFPLFTVFRSGSALSALDYTYLTLQLGALIVAKTGCPLLDLRPPRR